MAVHLVDCAYADQPGAAAAYVVEHDDGAYIVETNTAHAVDRILAVLGGLDLTPEQVTHIVITHIHLDHAGGASALLEACPNATLLAHPRAAPHAIDPAKLVASATQVYGAEAFAELYGTIEPIDAERVRTLDDEETLTVGGHTLRFLHTRGHANHHFCVLDERLGAIFTGDSFGIRYPGLPIFPSTSPTDFDAQLAIASIDRIVASGASEAWLTHFGVVRDLASAGQVLKAQLARYGALVDEADASGVEGAELHARCAAFVDGFFDELLPDATEAQRHITSVDRSLNAQGLAVAVQRRRKRRARAQS
jgi:glyoxylase-like metal-dependent hydrolase (beta-lactamase superfamily II)